MSMVQRLLYSPQYIISRQLLYNLIPYCANATSLTIDYPTIMDGLYVIKRECNIMDYMSS